MKQYKQLMRQTINKLSTVGLYMTEQEVMVLAYRYMYYVLATPAVTDKAYDDYERNALATHGDTAVLTAVGSSKWQDYPTAVRLLCCILFRLVPLSYIKQNKGLV